MLSLAVIIPVGPGHAKLAQQAQQSVIAATRKSGVFNKVDFLLIDDERGKLGRSKARNKGIKKALKGKYDWMLFIDADDILFDTAIADVEPLLTQYDAIWGKTADFRHGSQSTKLRPNQPANLSSYTDLLMADPVSALDMGYFAKTSCFEHLSYNEDREAGAEYILFLSLWKKFQCHKINSPLVAIRHGAQAGGKKLIAPELKRQNISTFITKQCGTTDVVSNFQYMGQPISMRITNPADIIQRSHINHSFFEALELFAINTLFSAGGNIIDAGSNIGNHTVFFSKLYKPEKIFCFECNPTAIALLQENLALNNCNNVDQFFLGTGLSDHEHEGSLDASKANNLGATSFKKTDNGDIEFQPLDSFKLQNIKLIKVDCEGMDLQVIRGAKEIISRDEPIIFFECFNEQYEPACRLMKELGYKIIHEFPYVNSKNIVAVKSN